MSVTFIRFDLGRETENGAHTCPVPTKTIGCPVTYVIDKAAPTYDRQGPYVGVCVMYRAQERTDLVVNGIPFGHKHSIDASSLTHTPDPGKITQGTVELGQLVNSFIPD